MKEIIGISAKVLSDENYPDIYVSGDCEMIYLQQETDTIHLSKETLKELIKALRLVVKET